jgi:hypothetical protein
VLGGRVRVSFFERSPMTFAASEVRPVAPAPGEAEAPTPTPVPVEAPPSDTDENPTSGNGE